MRHRLIFYALFYALITGQCYAYDVRFSSIRIPNDNEPPLIAGVWYPSDTTKTLPLIVMSHGGGGSYEAHADTARALAQAGFVVAAVSHAGDTFDDQSHVMELWRRPAQLHRLIDYMLADWSGHARVDGTRIGAFGFSNGGFTVLVSAGGRPDLADIAPYCRAHPDHDLCEALAHAGVDLGRIQNVPDDVWVRDTRIEAAVIAAPAFGFTFSKEGLSDVRIPIQLWRAADDRHQPDPFYEEAVRVHLPLAPDYHVVAHAGHYDFLPPCNARMSSRMPELCTSEAGFDRAAFHEQFNAEIVRFFRATLH